MRQVKALSGSAEAGLKFNDSLSFMVFEVSLQFLQDIDTPMVALYSSPQRTHDIQALFTMTLFYTYGVTEFCGVNHIINMNITLRNPGRLMHVSLHYTIKYIAYH